MSTSHQEQHTGGHPTFKQYALVASVLFVVTIIEFLLIWEKVGIDDDLGASKVPLLIIMSVFKFAIVIMFYMHLKFDAPLFSGLFLAGLGLSLAVGVALVGLFFGFEGKPRDYADANAIPYVEEEAHEEEAHESGSPADSSDSDSGDSTAAADTHSAGSESGTVADAGAPPADAPVEIAAAVDLAISADAAMLAFDVDRLDAKAGAEIKLTFTNPAPFDHNWVLIQEGTKDAVAAEGIAAGPDNNYVPPGDPRVLANSILLKGGDSETLSFTLEAGAYVFACTFPGHSGLMFGDLVVAP